MRSRATLTTSWILIIVALCLAFAPGLLYSYDKKLRVVADYAPIFMKPDDESAVLDTVARGTVLSLLTSGKLKKSWYYVCYKSEKTGVTKSGYVLDSAVELLFDPLKTILITEEAQGAKVNYAPRKFEEMAWGQSKKQVLEAEGKPIGQEKYRDQEIMRYQQKVINLDCTIDYIFMANRLVRTKFSFQNDSLDKNAYLKDYQVIKEALIQKFGKPLYENMNWRNSSYKDDFSSWGEAVRLGHLELSSRWQTPQTDILASLSGNRNNIDLIVEYASLLRQDVALKNPGE